MKNTTGSRCSAPGGARTRPFPWSEIAAFAFGHLGLAPHEFWQLTPRELALAVKALGGENSVPPQRATLETLMAAFPDRTSTANT
ncbi:MAG: rcc01693 family protein [Pseudomonadota bacterium]